MCYVILGTNTPFANCFLNGSIIADPERFVSIFFFVLSVKFLGIRWIIQDIISGLIINSMGVSTPDMQIDLVIVVVTLACELTHVDKNYGKPQVVVLGT
ncbi:MAG: hypothetical protein ACE3JK_11625 [Sporolactobacillus sp.]